MSPPVTEKMEDNKALNSLHTDGGIVDPIETRFADFCKVFIF